MIAAIGACYVKRRMTVVDAGANIGIHTFPLVRQVGRSGKVYAVEALPHLAEGLRTRGARFPQLQVFGQAIADRDGETPVSLRQAASGL